MISVAISRVKRTTHIYGIEVPTSMVHAQSIDKINNNTLWMDALSLEMNTIDVAFNFKQQGASAPPSYSKRSGQFIWDVKMDFTRKARWVKNGHLTCDPETSNFDRVVSQERIKIVLTYADLNSLNVCAAYIKSAYLQVSPSEKHHIICGDVFGTDKKGRIAVIIRALYGWKTARSDYWKHTCACMNKRCFNSCCGDLDLWQREAIKSDGTKYWEYCCLYVDDFLVISENPENIIREEISKYWILIEKWIGEPKLYLGNKVSKVTLENDVICWSFSSSQYV